MRNFFPKKIDLALILFVAVLLSCPLWSVAQGGYALDLNGTDDYIAVPYDASLNPTTIFTVEFWAKVEGGAGTWRSPVCSREVPGAGNTRGYLFYVRPDNNTWDFWTGSTGNSFSTVNSATTATSEWTHVAGSYDGTNLRIYINGVLTGTAAGNYTPNPDKPLRIGAGNTEDVTPAYYFDGKIDDVRIWSDVRTQAEIQASMHKSLVGNEANLVAYYDMANGSGTSLTDNSSNTNTGTLTNGPVWKTSGAHAGSGMALDFDGANDYVNLSSGPNVGNTFTLEAWIYSRSGADGLYHGFIGYDPGPDAGRSPSIWVYNETDIHFGMGGGGSWLASSSSNVISSNTWHHIATTFDGTNYRLYVDGIERTNYTGASGQTPANTQIYGIGRVDNYFAGNIDEVRFWSDARSEAEIRAYKDRSLDGDEANLVAYYRFDQQADAGNTTLYDYSANSNNGTLTNMTPATDWVTSNPFNTWVGADDGDWSNGDNWSSGSVPASSQDVGIFAWNATTNAPASANITGRNIFVDAGASMSSTGNLTLSDDFYNAGTFTTTGNVTFSGSVAQTIRGTGTTTFGTFTVNNSKGVVLATDLGVTSDLALTSGVVNLGGQTLTLGSSASVSGSPADGNHVNATSGTFRKSYSATGSFAFPVGDATLYSPITLNFTSGTFSSAYADVDLTIAKHPENISTGHYLSRYWTVSSSGISAFSCDVSATYVDGDITGTESELHGGKWDGSAWLDLGSATPASNLITGTVSGFSDFTGGQPYAFPVEWLNFSAKPAQDAVLLDWTTASEQNSDFFAIERSGNLEQWEELGTQAAAGNSTYQLDYQYEDQQPLAGTAWYRLRQVDLDGSFQYSATLAIHFAGAGIVVYPNPVKDKLTIEVPSGQQLSVELINLQGQQIWQQELTDGIQQLSLSELPSGLYTLRMRSAQNGETSYQIVKQ